VENYKIDISVVVSSFNRDGRVEHTLRSLFACSTDQLSGIEVIVIDDGSPQPVWDVFSKLQLPPKFKARVVRQENRGIGPTRNRGFREALYDHILFLDDDILVNPDVLHRFKEATVSSDAALIFGSYPFATYQSSKLKRFAERFYGFDKITTVPAFEGVNAITSGLLLVNRGKLKNKEFLYRDDLKIPAAEEFELIHRFHTEDVEIVQAHHIWAVHNHHLDLKWLADQQFKYGLAAAEVMSKYPETIASSVFSSLRASLLSLTASGAVGVLKRSSTTQLARRFYLQLSALAQKVGSNDLADRLFGLLTTTNFWAGYLEGRCRFQANEG
jgi:glycosyltransferase involved in cell wall biosynthesis